MAREAAEILADVREIHDAWGRRMIDELDPLDMWETLGFALGRVEQ